MMSLKSELGFGLLDKCEMISFDITRSIKGLDDQYANPDIPVKDSLFLYSISSPSFMAFNCFWARLSMSSSLARTMFFCTRRKISCSSPGACANGCRQKPYF